MAYERQPFCRSAWSRCRVRRSYITSSSMFRGKRCPPTRSTCCFERLYRSVCLAHSRPPSPASSGVAVLLASGVQRPPTTISGQGKGTPTVGSRPSDHYFHSVCWFVCLSVCLFVQSVSQPYLIRFRYMSGSSCVP